MIDMHDMEVAEEYAESIVWRLETLQHRTRYNLKTGELKRLPTRLRRFSNGIPQDNVAGVLAVLDSTVPYRGVVYNGEDDEDLEYRPTTTLIKKDQSLTTGADATYTIIQDLLLVSDPDFYASADSSSCSQVSETEWYWDEADVADCPDGEQGVTYQVVNVSRSQENDLFSYAIRKTVAVTQHMPETVVSCDRLSHTTVETWDNVYGEPDAFRWDSVRNGGEAIDIPADDPATHVCPGTVGVAVKVSVQENPDCTFKVQIERTKAKAMDWAEYMRTWDQYQKQSMDLHRNEASPYNKGKNFIKYGGGRIEKYETTENPDGTYNNRVSVTEEQTVPESTVAFRVTPYGTIKEWTDTNMVDPADTLPAGYDYGHYEFTKTPGGLFTNKYSGFIYERRSLGAGCKQTLYQHDHSSEQTLAEMPKNYRDIHVPAAHDGIITEYRVRRDSNGAIIQTDAVTEELTVPESTVQVTITPRYVATHRIDTNMPAPATGLLDGKFGSFKSTQTPGHLYTNEYDSYALVQFDFGKTRMRDAFRELHIDEDTVSDLSDIPQHVEDAAGGVIHQVQARVEDNGTVVRTEQTTREIEEQMADMEVRRTPKAVIRTRTDQNVLGKDPSAITDPEVPGRAEKRTLNPGRTANVTTTEVTPIEGARTDMSCQVTALEHAHTTDEVVDGLGPEKHEQAGGGRYNVTRRQVDDNGITTETTTETKELDHEFGTRVQENALQAYQTIDRTSNPTNIGDPSAIDPGFTVNGDVTQRGVATEMTDPTDVFGVTGDHKADADAGREAHGVLKEAVTMSAVASQAGFRRGRQVVRDSDLTRGGQFHTKDYVYIPKPQKWYDHIDTGLYRMSKWTFRNLTQEQIEPLLRDICEECARYNIGEFEGHPTIDRTINEFGLYDGTISYAVQAPKKSGGSASSSGKNEIPYIKATTTADWWEKTLQIVPIGDDPIKRPNQKVWFKVNVQWVHFAEGWGQSKKAYEEFLDDNNHSFWSGFNPSFDKSTESFTFRMVIETKLRSYYLEGDKFQIGQCGPQYPVFDSDNENQAVYRATAEDETSKTNPKKPDAAVTGGGDGK